MPTPVSVARQCLTTEAATALDEAVSVARRRNHSQTTSLHAISAILSLPSSTLRDACARVRSTTYSSRLQYRALELCFSSALDRLPSSQPQDDPPISNSFMAAIKRSQANQRRHPEAFSFHQQLQQQQQQSSSLSCVKVELQQLILSILDDPVVSRVFAEAGFRSCDLKLAILRPPPPISRYPRRPPLFLCNLPGSDSESSPRNFNFPFLGFSENEENCRRIGQILSRKERNLLLVGVSAIETVRSFGEVLHSGKGGVVPVEMSGVSFISIEKEISSGSERLLGLKFQGLDQLMESCSGPGVVIGYGDLRVLVDDGSVDVVSFVLTQLTRLLQVHRGKLWLMGAAAEYEMYLKFLMKFPSIEKDWDLQLLPITSVRSSMEGGFRARPHSLMESFVPFGGFFCMPSDLKGSLNSTCQPAAPCKDCNVKCEQEVSALLKGGCSLSVADQYRGSLPSWMHNMSECNAEKGLDMAQARDDGTILNAKVNGLQKKWSDICQRLNHCCRGSEADICRTRPQAFASIASFPLAAEKKEKEKTDNHSNTSSCSSINAFPEESEHRSILPSNSTGMQWFAAPNQNTKPVVSGTKNEDLASELQVRSSKSEWLLSERLQFPPCPADSSIPKSHESPSCPTVTTDLGLGTLYATCKEPKRAAFPAPKECLEDFTDCLPSKVDLANPNISKLSFRSSPFSGSNLSGQFDPKDFKSLWTSLSGKVGRQKEAVLAICESIAHCRTGNGKRRGARRDIWLTFVGPDRVAKRRIAFALAEMMFGNRESLISVDLSSQDGFTRTKTIFGWQDINDYDEKFRGKMVVDFIAEEISKKPLSIVFLENINKADVPLQNSLSHAIKTGKFSDSRSREISVNNVIFLATSETMKDVKCSTPEKVNVNFSEEILCQAQSSEMQIVISSVPEGNIMSNYSTVSITSMKESFGPVSVNKRKLVSNSDSNEQCDTPEWAKRVHKTTKFLDLNLPMEDIEGSDAECGSSDSDSVSQNSDPLLEDFFKEMDDIIPFEPFNFDALADRVIEETTFIFKSTIGPDARLEIDTKVMEQILAAAWLSDRTEAIKEWMEQVLRRSFTEAQQRYALSNRTVLKLVSCEGLHTKEQPAGICLPTKIILN